MPRGQLPEYSRGPVNDRGYTPRIDQTLPSADYSGLQYAGANLQNLANQGARYNLQEQAKLKEKQERFDSQQALKTFSEFQIANQKRKQEFRTNYQGELLNFAEEDFKNEQDFFGNFQTEPMSQGAEDKYRELYSRYQVTSSAESLSYQTRAVGAKAKRDYQETSGNFINMTRLDPRTYEANKAELEKLADTWKGLIDPEDIQALKDQSNIDNAVALIRGEADADPEMALQNIKDGKYNKILPPGVFDRELTGLVNQIEAEAKQKQAKLRSDIAGQMDDHFASIYSTRTPVLTRATVEATNDPDLLEEYDFRTKVAYKANEILQGKEGLPFQDQLALVEGLKPKPGSENFADEEKVYNALREAVREQNKAYMEDPVAGSMSNGQVSQQFNLSTADGIKASLNHQMAKGLSYSQLTVATNERVAEQAAEIVEMINNNQFDDAKARMASLEEEYNVAKLPDGRTGWDIFKNQLARNKENKVPETFLVALQYNDIPEGNEIFQAYKGTLDSYKKNIGPENYKQIESSVDSSFNEYKSIMSKIPGFSGVNKMAVERGLLIKYSAYLMDNQGLNATEASKKAYKTLYPYELTNNSKERLVIPKSVGQTPINPTTVKTSLNTLRNVDLLYSHLTQGAARHTTNKDLAKLSVKDATDGSDAFLRYDAAQKFEDALSSVKTLGKTIQVNSARRSRAEQQVAYDNYKRGGPTAAKPGHSSHEDEKGAIGLDVGNYNDPVVKRALEANGFVHKPHPKDPWHFEYVGKYPGVRKEFGRIADEGKRRAYADSLSKTGVWVSDGDLHSVTLYSKNADGSMTPVYNGFNKPYRYSLIDLQAGKFNKTPTVKAAKPKAKPTSISKGARDNYQKGRDYQQYLSIPPQYRDQE